ncbi:MAG: ferrochelatase [Myxococcota bacterium]|nr:ferrochelatase [Myxococcota bacterium]MDW8363110.1 ferrochelatase [Myxococcales bacterium]
MATSVLVATSRSNGWADALMVLSFGGPDGPAEVWPFLERVTGGRIPRERLEAVAARYMRLGGRSPIHDEDAAFVAAIREELDRRGPALPVYLAHRLSRPFVDEALAAMARDGVQRAAVFVTSAFGSPPSCRAYTEALDAARSRAGSSSPQLARLGRFALHPLFLEIWIDNLRAALERAGAARSGVPVLFTAHSIPRSMARVSPYERELRAASEAVAGACAVERWESCWQSRSGPADTWLGPDVAERVETLAREGHRELVVVPIGFFCDHMEVVWDLDVELRRVCERLGVRMHRVATPARDPRAAALVRELLLAGPSSCDPGCCVAPERPPDR